VIRLTEYDACEKLFREIMEQLTMRDGEPKTSKAYASLSANIRLRMKQYTREVQQLKCKLEEASKLKTMYSFICIFFIYTYIYIYIIFSIL